ncbi:MAG: hypothetical protein ACRCYC_17885 [Paraclostridium sp.]|uniref:hypothetical protein n=1 Tax=Paraclostridium sp. TaxID=2023273 RepID=UPI003F30CB86
MKKIILEQLLSYIEKNPEKNVGKIISIAKKLVKNPYDKQGVELLEHFYNDVPSVKELLARVGDEIDPEIVKTFFKNFVIKGIWEGGEIRDKFYEETGGRQTV